MTQLKITELNDGQVDLDLQQSKLIKGGRTGLLNSSDSSYLSRLLRTGGNPSNNATDYTPRSLLYRY